MRGGFITETIPGYSEDLKNGKGDNWECVEDFHSSYCEDLDGGALNICAWFNKVSRITYFGGQWWDVPPKCFGSKPSDKDIWDWTNQYSWVNKRMAATVRCKKKFQDGMDAITAQNKNGINFVYAVLEKDGELIKTKQPIGQRNILEALQLVRENIDSSIRYLKREKKTPNKYCGAKIKKLIVKRATYDEVQKWWKGEAAWNDEDDIICGLKDIQPIVKKKRKSVDPKS